MSEKDYKKVRAILIIVTSLIIGLAIEINSVLLILVGFISMMFIMSLVKVKVKPIEDERLLMVTNKAAQIAFSILLPILATTSLALLVAGRQLFYLHALAVILGYITCLGLTIYLVAYYFLNRKLGG